MSKTGWVRRKRVFLKRRPLNLPETLSDQRSPDALVDSIRLLWLQGRCDAEVRRILGLNIDQFRELKQLMRTSHPSRENALAAFERYCDTHEKFKAVQEEKLKILSGLYDAATKPEPMESRPYDIRAARLILHDMSVIDTAIRENETLLLSIKVQLRLIIPERETPQQGLPGAVGEPEGEEQRLFSSVNVKTAWKQRMENEKAAKARDVTP